MISFFFGEVIFHLIFPLFHPLLPSLPAATPHRCHRPTACHSPSAATCCLPQPAICHHHCLLSSATTHCSPLPPPTIHCHLLYATAHHRMPPHTIRLCRHLSPILPWSCRCRIFFNSKFVYLQLYSYYNCLIIQFYSFLKK